MPTLAVATIMLNEEPLCRPMLEGARLIADEIVVGIDSRTIDRTAEIVWEYGGTTFPIQWDDDFAAARNEVLERVTSDWVLVMDADDRLTNVGVAVIRDILSRPDSDQWHGFSFMQLEVDLQGLAKVAHRTSIRLFQNRPDIRYRGVVHEEPWLAEGEAQWCFVPDMLVLAHVGYCPEVYVAKKKHERNLRLNRKRVALDPADDYSQWKLQQELSVDDQGIAVGGPIEYYKPAST